MSGIGERRISSPSDRNTLKTRLDRLLDSAANHVSDAEVQAAYLDVETAVDALERARTRAVARADVRHAERTLARARAILEDDDD